MLMLMKTSNKFMTSIHSHTYTILPQIAAWVFISFQWFFTPATKWHRHLLVEDSHAVYNLIPVVNSEGSWWWTKHYTSCLILLHGILPWPLNDTRCLYKNGHNSRYYGLYIPHYLELWPILNAWSYLVAGG